MKAWDGLHSMFSSFTVLQNGFFLTPIYPCTITHYLNFVMNSSNFSYYSNLVLSLHNLSFLFSHIAVLQLFVTCPFAENSWLHFQVSGEDQDLNLPFVLLYFCFLLSHICGMKQSVECFTKKTSFILLSTPIPFPTSLIWHMNFLAVAHLALLNLFPDVHMLLIRSEKNDATPSL